MSKYQALIDALKAGPTEGPWNVIDHSWSDTSIVAPGFDHGICCLDINHATEESQDSDGALMAANAAYIAAANPATIRSLLADLERAEKDAERYRFLRSQHEESDSGCSLCVFEPINDQTLEPVGCIPGELDAAIDAALSQLKGVQ